MKPYFMEIPTCPINRDINITKGKGKQNQKWTLPADLCTSSPRTLDPATHAYNLYNNMSKNPILPPFLSNPVQSGISHRSLYS